MKIASFPGMYAFRFPHFAPEDDLGGGEEIDPAFIEQPGDRVPDPGDEPAAEAEPEEAEGEGEGHVEEEADSTDDVPAEATVEAEAEGEEEAEEEAPKPKKDWRDRQIIKARQAEKAASERAAALAKEVEELKAAQANGDGTVLTQAERDKIRQEAAEEVRRETWAKTLNTNCDAMFDAGAKAFPKTWEQRVAAAGEVFSDELRARPDFLEAVTELDNAAAVYHELAGDPDKMEEVLELPPHKMGMELARISARLSAAPKPKTISKAPAPIRPLDGPTLQERSLEDLANDPSPAAMAEFDRRMDAEERRREGVR